MCRLQFNLNPSNWLVLKHFGFLGEKTETLSTATPPTSTTTTTTPPISPTPLTKKPPKIPMDVITAKSNLETDILARLRVIKILFNVSSEDAVTTDFNRWDGNNYGHLRGLDWKTLLKGVIKDTGKNDGEDDNFFDTKENIIAGTTEYVLTTVLKGQFAIYSISDEEKKPALEPYIKKYQTGIDKVYYNDVKYKGKIEALGLTVPPKD